MLSSEDLVLIHRGLEIISKLNLVPGKTEPHQQLSLKLNDVFVGIESDLCSGATP
ncbi:unnamed protein product, partial [Allacma fusca]